MIDLQKIAGLWQFVDVSNVPDKESPSEEVIKLATKIHESRMGSGDYCEQCLEMAKAEIEAKNQ